MIYLDNAATTRTRQEAAEAAFSAMREDFANPSSTHSLGRRAAGIITRARLHVAAPLGASPAELVFTSGGTEANNLAVLGGAAARKRHGKHIITTQTEHDSVRKPAQALVSQGFDVTFLLPDATGRITLSAFSAALREDTILASVMLVNNETGAVNPVAELSHELHAKNPHALFHTDAVQGYGKLAVNAKALGADMVSVSAHKIYGVKGVGALYIRSGVKLAPRIIGGEHEYGMRAGTEPVPAIAAFGEAARLAREELDASFSLAAELRALAVSELRSRLKFLSFITDEDGIGVLNGAQSPYVLSIALPGYRSEVLMTALEDEGVLVSRSSACKKGARSHVLEAMGLANEVIDGALRISFSRETTADEVRQFAEKLQAVTSRIFTRR